MEKDSKLKSLRKHTTKSEIVLPQLRYRCDLEFKRVELKKHASQ